MPVSFACMQEGQTVLFIAAKESNTTLLKVLLLHKANADAEDKVSLLQIDSHL